VKILAESGLTAKILEGVEVGKLLVSCNEFSEPEGQIQAEILGRRSLKAFDLWFNPFC
jgi:hypothetical protein